MALWLLKVLLGHPLKLATVDRNNSQPNRYYQHKTLRKTISEQQFPTKALEILMGLQGRPNVFGGLR
jgi:hypothetical protein